MSNVDVYTWREWKNQPTDPPDAVVQAALNAAEAAIAADLGRLVAVAADTADARTFGPDFYRDDDLVLSIHDCTAVTAITDNGTSLTAGTNYQLEPIGGIDAIGNTVPYTHIRRIDGSPWYRDPYGKATAVVTAKWGWAALPAWYTEAVKILAADVMDQRDIRNGIVGFTEYAGVRVRANPMVTSLLDGWRRGASVKTPGLA